MSNRTSLKQQLLYFRRQHYYICDDLHHCLFGSFVKNLLLNRQSFIFTTNATMQVFTLSPHACEGRCRYIYKLLVRSPEANTANIIEHEYMARGLLHFLRVQLQQNMTGLVFSWVCIINACLVRLYLHLVILAPVSSSAHCCSCFHGTIFFTQ